MTTTITVTTKVATPSIVEATIHDGLSQHTWPCPNSGDMLSAAFYAVDRYASIFCRDEIRQWVVTHEGTRNDGDRLYVMTAR